MSAFAESQRTEIGLRGVIGHEEEDKHRNHIKEGQSLRDILKD